MCFVCRQVSMVFFCFSVPLLLRKLFKRVPFFRCSGRRFARSFRMPPPHSQYFSRFAEIYSIPSEQVMKKKIENHTVQMKSLIDYRCVYGPRTQQQHFIQSICNIPMESVFRYNMDLCASAIISVRDTISFVCISINYASVFLSFFSSLQPFMTGFYCYSMCVCIIKRKYVRLHFVLSSFR